MSDYCQACDFYSRQCEYAEQKNRELEHINMNITLQLRQRDEAIKVMREALDWYNTNCVAKGEFINGEFADHPVTGFQPSNVIAKKALAKAKEIMEGGK